MKFNQKGFTLIEGLLIVLILSVVCFAGYAVWNNQQDKTEYTQIEQSDEKAAIDNLDASSSTVTYVNEEYSFSMDVPKNWETLIDSGPQGEQKSKELWLGTNISIPTIVISSSEFMGGFNECTADTDLGTITVKHNKPTQDSDYRVVDIEFNTYEYRVLGIVRQNSSPFLSEKSLNSPEISYSDMKTGSTYYYCPGLLAPITWLDLDNDQFATREIISVSAQEGSFGIGSEVDGSIFEALESFRRK